MNARLVEWDEDRPGLRGWQWGRLRLGSWGGPAPHGGCCFVSGAARTSRGRIASRGNTLPPMLAVDLRTGHVAMIGPRGRLPA